MTSAPSMTRIVLIGLGIWSLYSVIREDRRRIRIGTAVNSPRLDSHSARRFLITGILLGTLFLLVAIVTSKGGTLQLTKSVLFWIGVAFAASGFVCAVVVNILARRRE